MKEIIKKIDAAVRVLNNIEVKQKQNLLNMGGVIDLLESVIVDLQKMDIEATLNKENVEGEDIRYQYHGGLLFRRLLPGND